MLSKKDAPSITERMFPHADPFSRTEMVETFLFLLFDCNMDCGRGCRDTSEEPEQEQ